MSTRSVIGKKLPDGTYRTIYCHFDGYPEHQEPILKKHYNTEELVDRLLDLGDLSVLGETLGEKHDFSARIKGVCLAYGRDRGEKNVGACICEGLLKIAKRYSDCEYLYIFEDGKWETEKL